MPISLPDSMKHEMSSVDIAAVVSEIQSLVGSRIDKIYQHSRNGIRIKTYSDGDRYDLLIEAGKIMYLTKYPLESPKVAPSFCMFLRKHLRGARITSVRQYDFDRIVEIGLERADKGVMTLVVELFSKGNVILLDDGQRVIIPLRSLHVRDRTIAKGEVYTPPPALSDPLTIGLPSFAELLAEHDDEVVRVLASTMNLGGLYAEEMCLRSNVDKNRRIEDLSAEDVERLHCEMHSMLEPLISEEFNHHIVLEDGEEVDVISFPLQIYGKHDGKHFDSFNEALDAFFTQKVMESVETWMDEKRSEELGVPERMISQQEQAIQEFEQEEKLSVAKAEAIYAHYPQIEEILTTINQAREDDYSWEDIKSKIQLAKDRGISSARLFKSIDESRGVLLLDLSGVEVSIDVFSTINQNAQRYYERSKSMREKRDGAERALESTRKQLEILSEREFSPEEMVLKPKRVIRIKQHWYTRFRWFISSDGFLVVGGRDADTNEELVKRHMEKDDLFMHADAQGAPAILIKTEGYEVPETTFKEAAVFAVSYSNLWKSGFYEGDCYWVRPDQVSKTPEAGEYITKGSFIIRRRRNYMRNVPVGVSIGVEIDEETRVIGGPLESISEKGKYRVELEPGEMEANQLSKEIFDRFLELASVEDENVIKKVATPDQIRLFLPPGRSRMKKV